MVVVSPSGSPVSFSNPILWHRGQNLTVHSDPRKTPHGVYQTFFSWFSDHSNPGRDDIAQVNAERLRGSTKLCGDPSVMWYSG